jgi:hypothetical protein
MSDRVPLSAEMVESMCARIDASNLPEQDRPIVKAALRDYVRLGQTFLEKSDSINRLLGDDLRLYGKGIEDHPRAQEDGPSPA